MIEMTSGDMFARPFDIRVNTVNCVGVMGAGVALAFKERYPEMFREYRAECRANHIRPGKLHVWRQLHGDWIINFPTKRHWRENSQYEDIEAGLRALRDYLRDKGPVTVALPALGCGHGGLEWDRVAAMIRRYLTELDARISVFEPRDSRVAGERVRAASDVVDEGAMAAAGVKLLVSSSAGFPNGLRNSGFERLYCRGDERLLDAAIVAIITSYKPSDREEVAVAAITNAFERRGVVLAVVLAGRLSRSIVETAVGGGIKVAAWLPQGILAERAPAWLEGSLDDGNAVIASVAPCKASWSPGVARDASGAAASSATAVVVTDPEPLWISRASWRRQHERSGGIFYVHYGDVSSAASDLWRDLRATAIGRRRSGSPNVDPVIRAIQHGSSTLTVAAGRRDMAAAHTANQPLDVQAAAGEPGSTEVAVSAGVPTGLFEDSEQPKAKKRRGRAKKAISETMEGGPRNLGVPLQVTVPDFSDPNRPKTCLEVDFPLVPINALSSLEGNAGKPIYQMSKWWARRRSCVFRAMLLAAGMEAPSMKHPDGQSMLGPDGKPIVDEDAAAQAVWDAYYANHQAAGNFKHLKVLDPFMGGGTTLVEGSRLGFQVAGIDLNPVAWFIVKNELACTDPKEVKAFFDQIEAEVKPQIQPFYVTDGVAGRKGTWVKRNSDGTREEMPAGFDPVTLPPDQRKPYQYEGPEIIYTFWAKHGPCIKPGCGHRTPIFRSPIVATKKLGVKYIPCTCKKCKTVFHAELGDARIAPDAEHIVLENEYPYTVLSPAFAKGLLDYSKGTRDEQTERIRVLHETVAQEPGFHCPRCGTWSGQTPRDILEKHHNARSYGEIDKKDLGIVPARNGKKPVYCTLLMDPEWLKGSPGEEAGKEIGGFIDAPIDATGAWYRERLKHLRLIEVRGVAGDAVPDGDDENTSAAEEGAAAEATEDDAEGEKTWVPATITLQDGRKIETGRGTVPKRSAFACGSCGQLADLLDSVKGYTTRARMETHDAAAQRSAPVMVYCLQCYDPQRDAEGHPYGGRFFKVPDAADIERLIVAEREWAIRREADLKDFWPRSVLPHTWMTHHLNGGIPNWGFTHWYKFFNPRQLIVQAKLLHAIEKADASVAVREFALAGYQQYLRNQNMGCIWDISRDCLAPFLSNPHFHPKALVVENSVYGSLGRGNWTSCAEGAVEAAEWGCDPTDKYAAVEGGATKTVNVLPHDGIVTGSSTVVRGSSTEMPADWTGSFDNVITDPPFGDNLFYGDLSNFFYVWLRLALKDRCPEQYGPDFVPRSQEAVADRSRFPNADTDEEAAMSAANAAYQALMTACWAECRRVMKDGGVMAFTFHHSADEPWMSILQSLFDAGWLLEATYPIRSDETKGEGGQFGSRKIEYDIIHVCRKRLEEPKQVSWPKMRQWVKAEMLRLRPLLESYKARGLQDADVRVILRGKALEFYSRHYGTVMVSAPGGEDMVLSIRDALLGINQLLDESSGQPGERPPSIVQPVVYQYLRLFGAKASYSRDEVSKLLRGTAIQQRDFERVGSTPWIAEEDKFVSRVRIHDRFPALRKLHRNQMKTELDQAHFLIGAAFEGSGVTIDEELEKANFLIRPGVDALLDWYAKTPAGPDEPDVPRAAAVALQLLRAAFEARRARMREEQPTLFDEWEASLATVA